MDTDATCAMISPRALYVHLPFCRARCAYCDFNTYAGLEELVADYVDAVCLEVEQVAGNQQPATSIQQRVTSDQQPATIYFGGGTPSLLPLPLLAQLLDVLRLTFYASHSITATDSPEITLEANPGTVDESYFRGLRELGVNRLSLGIQSAHDDELRLLGRIHTWAQAVAAVEAARAADFDNLNFDFIYGLPGQTVGRWWQTLQAALRLAPAHLSLYALTVEEGTPLAARIARGELSAPDEDRSAEMFELAEQMLGEAGYGHYEISNWAMPDCRLPIADCYPESAIGNPQSACRHNLVYWRNEPYLGFGAGAASWWGGRRWSNLRHPADYIACLRAGRMPVEESEEIPPRLEMGEMMMMGLRLAEGVGDARFRARFGQGLEATFGPELAVLRESGLLEWDGQVARLTARGRLLGNLVFQRFLP